MSPVKMWAEITGERETASILHRASREFPDETRQVVESELGPVSDALQVYPPERPGQKYKRTFNYRRLVSRPQVRVTGRQVEAQIVQGAEYSIYVRGDMDGKGQAPVHQGRWDTTKAIWERYISRVVKRIQMALVNLLSASRGGR